MSQSIYAHEKQRERGAKKRVVEEGVNSPACPVRWDMPYLVEILCLVCHFGCLQLARLEIVIPLKLSFVHVQGAPFAAAQRPLPPGPHAFPADAQHAQRSCQTGKQVLHRRVSVWRPFARLIAVDPVALDAGFFRARA